MEEEEERREKWKIGVDQPVLKKNFFFWKKKKRSCKHKSLSRRSNVPGQRKKKQKKPLSDCLRNMSSTQRSETISAHTRDPSAVQVPLSVDTFRSAVAKTFWTSHCL
jgi:hypothetical protein